MVLFIVLQLLNVIVSTFKSVLTIKGTKLIATFINAIAYSVNIAVVYIVADATDLTLFESMAITFLANMVGVYAGLTLLERLRKDELWRISTTVKTELLHDYKKELLLYKVEFIAYETSYSSFKVVDIFSSSKEETKIIKPILEKYNAKYTAYSNRINL